MTQFDLWQPYFDGQHAFVVREADQRLGDLQAADILHVSGLSLLASGAVEAGVGRLRAALALCPALPEWWANASIGCLQHGALAEAETFARDGLKLYPEHAMMHYALGNALMQQGDPEGARASYAMAVLLKPEFADARLNLGNAYRRTDRPQAALECYDYLLASDPDYMPALVNRGGVLIDLNRLNEAEVALGAALTRHPGTPELKFLLSFLLLGQGEFPLAWELYRTRWEIDVSKHDRKHFRRPFAADLASLRERHVVVCHEQGFGDSLQFVRFVPQLAAHCGRLSIVCPAPLLRLFRASYPEFPVEADRDRVPSYDLEVPMLDMPALLGTTQASIPARLPYLTVPDELAAAHRLPPTSNKRIGLVWAGQRRADIDLAAVDRRRSMPLAEFAALTSLPGIDWISLQLGEPCTQIAGSALEPQLQQPLRPQFDFADTAAVVQQLDLVIAVDTAIIHLAAGLGVPTWILSRFDGCWRWGRGFPAETPWYPRVVRLFHQPRPGEWTELMQQVQAALVAWLAAPDAPASAEQPAAA